MTKNITGLAEEQFR